MRKSNYFFIDATKHKPPGRLQFLIIMYKNIINGEKYPGYMNNKFQDLYTKIFKLLFSFKICL